MGMDGVHGVATTASSHHRSTSGNCGRWLIRAVLHKYLFRTPYYVLIIIYYLSENSTEEDQTKLPLLFHISVALALPLARGAALGPLSCSCLDWLLP